MTDFLGTSKGYFLKLETILFETILLERILLSLKQFCFILQSFYMSRFISYLVPFPSLLYSNWKFLCYVDFELDSFLVEQFVFEQLNSLFFFLFLNSYAPEFRLCVQFISHFLPLSIALAAPSLRIELELDFPRAERYLEVSFLRFFSRIQLSIVLQGRD